MAFHGLLDGPRRDFLREVERNLRTPLAWNRGRDSAAASLASKMQADPHFLLKVMDFALHNITIGYTVQVCDEAALELDRILRESGTVWEVQQVPQRAEYFLQRRVSEAASSAVARLQSQLGREVDHLTSAWSLAFGRSPNPSEAYREAVKAVEEAAIPVVIPNDPQATLGKVIGEMRSSPGTWNSIFHRPVASPANVTPVEVVIHMAELLWRNETDRHAPVTPVTQGQAEFAVHLALTLVVAFRSGAIT